MELNKLIAKELRNLADKFDANTTEASESQTMEIVSILTHRVMSKAQACQYLNMSRSKFDDLVSEKTLPQGRSNVGFKEKCWYQDELDAAVRRLKAKAKS